MVKTQQIKFLLIILITILTNCTKKQDYTLSDAQKKYIKNNIIPESKYLKQRCKSRTYINDQISLVYRIKPDSLYMPIIFASEIYKSNLFTIDNSSCLIHKINLNTGKHIIFGKGRGRGPGELIGFSGMEIIDDVIFIYDNIKNRLECYSTRGKYLKSITLQENNQYYRYCKSNHSLIFYSYTDRIRPLHMYNLDGNLEGKLGVPLKEKYLMNIFYHDCLLTEQSSNDFLQIPIKLGIFGNYKKNKLINITESIDGNQNPTKQGQPLSSPMDTPLFTAYNCDSNSKLLLIKQMKEIDHARPYPKREYIYDFYSITNFSYLFSLKLPDTKGCLLADNNNLVSIRNNGQINIYSIKSLQNYLQINN